jgi:septal ring factor EnvC (AmiA/AmiB activator)
MDWAQALTVIGVFIGGFIYLISKLGANQRENNARFDQVNSKFESVNSKFNGIENRLTAMEGDLKNLSQRIDNVNQRITDLKTDMNQRLATIEGYLVPKKVFHFKEN